MHLGALTFKIERWPRRSTAKAPLVVATAAALLALVVLTAPASADTSAASTGSVNVLVRSVSVSPSTFSYSFCSLRDSPHTSEPGLTIPDGNCSSGHFGSLIVTNGPVNSHLEVSSTPFTPSDGGTAWSLCTRVVGGRPDLPQCTGPAWRSANLAPGTDEAIVQVWSALGGGWDLSSTPHCYSANVQDCMQLAGRVDGEYALMYGPNASTDPSATFSNTITWTAVP